MRRLSKLLFPVLTALLLVAPPASADTTQTLEGWPEWAQQGMEKEAKRLKYRKVETGDKSVRSKLPGKPQDPEAIDGGWYFITDFKAESPLECYLFTESRNLATLVDLVAEINIEAVAGSHDNVGNRRVYHTGAGEVGGMPYLALEWIYTVQTGDQVMVGFTKVRAATKGATTMACTHNYLGYRGSFAEAFREFVVNMQVADTSEAPFYDEIATLDVNGIGSGVAYLSYTIDADGDIKMYATQSALVPVDAATLTTSDSFSVSYTTTTGELINAVSVGVENGETSSDMSLQRNEAGNWVSGGTMQGKELSYEIDGSLEPASEWAQLAIARDLFAGEEATSGAFAWLPDLDPTQFVEATMTRDDAEVERQAIMNIGPLTYTGLFDSAGNVINADMSVGPMTIRIARVWSQGSILQ